MSDNRVVTGFCESCVKGSTAESPGAISTGPMGIGRTFYGEIEKCGNCHSDVRVLWFVLAGVPIIPLGTYRYKQIQGGVPTANFMALSSRFLARRTHPRWGQIFTHWSVGFIIGFAVIALYAKYG